MIVRIARHGQPALEGMPAGADHELPPGDYPLSALGRRQAELLGRHLKSVGFAGRIVASPYARTAETASVVCAAGGWRFHLEPRLQEMRFYPEPPCPGMTLAELRRNYREVAPDAELVWPWLTPGGPEPPESVRERVDAYVEELVRNPPAEDLLLIGHGASVQSLKANLLGRAGCEEDGHCNWNCSLSVFEVDAAGRARALGLARIDFMPLALVTSNKRRWGDPACP